MSELTDRLAPMRSSAPALLALSGLAVAQPLLDLLGKNPEFFIAADLGRREIITLGLVLVFAIPLAATVIEGLARLLDPRFGSAVHTGLVLVLSATLGLGVARQLGMTGRPAMVAVAAGLAVAVAVAERRWNGFRQALSYLALAPVAFLGLFLVSSDTARLLRTEEAAAEEDVTVVEPGPVVVLVLDELPLVDLVTEEGVLATGRFPGFDRLASESTWYPEATSGASNTVDSLPTIVTGLEADNPDDLPISADHPRSLFTLLGGTHEAAVTETVTDLCPDSVCEAPPPAPEPEPDADPSPPPPEQGDVQSALSDTAVIFGHVTLPDHYRRDLPPVDKSWGDFIDAGADLEDDGSGADPGVPDVEPAQPDAREGSLGSLTGRGAQRQFLENRVNELREPEGARSALEAAIAALEPNERSLVFMHDGFMPHQPWDHAPSGASYSVVAQALERTEGEDEALVRLAQQRHLLQVAYADRLVSDLMQRLKDAGVWKRSLVVVTADHGVAFEPGKSDRRPGEATLAEVYPVPLFVKAPGQDTGSVDERIASSVDILPSVVDALGIQIDWEFDGRSLLGPPRGGRSEKRVSYRDVVEDIDVDISDVAAVAARDARRYPVFAEGGPATDVVRVGRNAGLVGRPVDPARVTDGPLTWSLDRADAYQAVVPGATVPIMVSGVVHAGGQEPPDEVLVAVNGLLAGVAVPRPVDGNWVVRAVVDEGAFVPGPNEVELYVAGGSGLDVSFSRIARG